MVKGGFDTTIGGGGDLGGGGQDEQRWGWWKDANGSTVEVWQHPTTGVFYTRGANNQMGLYQGTITTFVRWS